MSLALIPGSFDPMTLGHLALVEQVLREYDEVVVAVMVNAQKTTLLDMETRVEIARRTVAHLPNVRVISDRGMLIDLFDRLGADAVCKGYRNETDHDYEMNMAKWNKEHNPRFRTALYRSEGALATLSSTEVRRRLAARESLDGLVTPTAIGLLTEHAREGAV